MGQPASCIKFGPFSGVGMAAEYAESMRDVGLPPLPPSACAEGFNQAGYGSGLVCASIDLSRFSQVNQAKSAWPYLDCLATLPKVDSFLFLSYNKHLISHSKMHRTVLKLALQNLHTYRNLIIEQGPC